MHFRVKTKVPMSQVAVLPHQTSNGSASASSASQPDIGQLSLHNVASTRRKSSFSNVNNYRTMPLSRTRSLLANINGVASNGKQPQDQLIWPRPFFTIISRKTYKTSLLVLSKNLSITKAKLNVTGTASNGSGGSTANTPGSEANGYALPSINGSSDHLPPLKNSANNNNKLNGVNGVNGVNGYHSHDMDIISASAASTTTSLTNGHLSHLNGMQTLPHVRSSGVGNAEITESQTESQQSSQQQPNNNQQSGSVTQSVSQQSATQSVQQSPTNNSSAMSNNAVNSANNSGSLKPKTMVATPEQVRLYKNHSLLLSNYGL